MLIANFSVYSTQHSNVGALRLAAANATDCGDLHELTRTFGIFAAAQTFCGAAAVYGFDSAAGNAHGHDRSFGYLVCAGLMLLGNVASTVASWVYAGVAAADLDKTVPEICPGPVYQMVVADVVLVFVPIWGPLLLLLSACSYYCVVNRLHQLPRQQTF